MKYLEKFNETFKAFVDDLCVAYPNDGEFRMCKMLLNTALIADDAFLQRFFYQKVVLRYESEILHQNEEFFLAKDYTQYADKISGASKLIAKVKSCWVDMTAENKEVVWRYLRVLTVLAKKVSTPT